jgi:hypothetical protein
MMYIAPHQAVSNTESMLLRYPAGEITPPEAPVFSIVTVSGRGDSVQKSASGDRVTKTGGRA